jgi:lysozyme
MLKKLFYLLALWFLIDWAYHSKIKPFVTTQQTPQKTEETVAKVKLPNINNKSLVKDSITFGLDISHYQGDLISGLNKKKDSLYFVICKATEGTNITDANFANNWSILKSKKVIRGAYHFYHNDQDPKQQAQYFTKTIMENYFLNAGQLPPVLDIENSSMDGNSSDLKTVQQNILTFLNEVQKITGRIPMIYTNKSTGNKYLNDKAFAAYPLWIAAYTSELTPSSIPTAWNNEWKVWQRSESYSYQGANFDFDVFNGSRLELRKFIQSTIVKK